MAITVEERKKITEWQIKFPQFLEPCKHCGSTQFSEDLVLTLEAIDKMPSSKGHLLYQMSCKNCGDTRLFKTAYMGL